MSKEKRQPESHLRLQDVLQLAEEVILRDGHHLPTLLVEGSTDYLIMQMPGLPSEPEARQAMLFAVGALLSTEHSVGSLRQVFLITEGWLSVEHDGKPPVERPSQDPRRKEVLVIAAVYPPTGKQALKLREMIRDANGQLIDLLIYRPPGKEVEPESPLLQAFVAGYQINKGPALR